MYRNSLIHQGAQYEFARKLWLVMRIVTFLVLVTLTQVSASTFAQRIYIKDKHISIEEVFRKIREQSGYDFIYNRQLIKDIRPLTLTLQHVSLDEAMKEVLAGHPLSYRMEEKTIIIEAKAVRKEKAAPQMEEPILQERRIAGAVRNPEGIPLPGVSVLVKGTTHGTTTDTEGRFQLTVKEGAVLVVKSIGYQDREISTGNQMSLEIVLQLTISDLDEIVVVGYGTQKKVNLTGSVDVVSGKQLENRSAASVADLIKGASPNLNIAMNMRGGEPGAVSSWNIRGMGSINGNGSPLVLVDGVEMNISNVDPESIESVSILKDASASAIYGSRAPFGVILITTKHGRKDQPVSIKYTNNLSLASPIKLPSFIDSYTWATAYNQAASNAGATAVYSDEQMGRIRGYLDGTFLYEYDPERPIDNIFAGRRNGNANYDWPQILIKDLAFSQKHNINISGGNDKTQYYVAGGMVEQDGLYEYGHDSYHRYNFLTNFNSQITDWLNFNSSVKFANSQTDFPLGQTTVGREHFFQSIIMFGPMTPFYNINGTIQNPQLRLSQSSGRDKTDLNDFFLTLGSELEPIKGWKTRISYNYNVTGSRNASNPKPVMVELGDGSFGNIGKPSTGYTTLFRQETYSLVNATTSYELNVNGHSFVPLVGYEQESRLYTGLIGTGENLITEDIPSIATSLGDRSVDDQQWHWATQGVFGRLNYNYQEKYLFETSARYNGSSRFAQDSRWGFFPSASAGYNISNENFWNPLKSHVNLFKIRGSYGSLGNQNVDNYLYLSTIVVSNELDWIIDQQRPPYATTPILISDNLTWETITTLNLGLDAAFLNNRLNVTFDWYNRKSSDMVGEALTLPYALGSQTPQTNNAELSTKGFELLLGWEDRIKEDFSYNVRLALGDSHSTILKYENEKGLINTWYAGKQVGEMWGLQSDGLIQTAGERIPDQSRYHPNWRPGDMKYKDLNGDGFVNDGTQTLDDHGDLMVIGNDAPRYNIGLTAGFNWKGLDFNMFWQGVGRRNYHPDINSTLFWGMTTGFSPSGLYKDSPALDYWRPADETNILGPNTDAYFAKPYFSAETNKNRQHQSRYVLNAAYLRLKNLQIGYTLPGAITRTLFVQRARLYFSGENLMLLSGLPKIFDPETAFASDPSYGGYITSGVIYPISSSFSMGVNLTF